MRTNDVRFGQKVMLKTGGHVMQVSGKHPFHDWPLCVWSSGKMIREAYVDPGLLKVVPTDFDPTKAKGIKRISRVL